MTTTHRADCGHTYTPPTPGIGGPSGYAVDRETGRTMCYSCADEAQRAEVLTADRFTVYLSSDGRTVTTWTGGELGKVQQMATRPNYTPTGGEWYAVRVRMAGADWYGRTAGPGMYANLRRSKVAA